LQIHDTHQSHAMTTSKPPQPLPPGESGLHKGLTSYGDKGFSLFLRKAFIKGAGYTDSALGDRRR
jgi:dihydroxy-acid dehydratase